MNEKEDGIFINHILDSIGAIEEFSLGLTEKEFSLNRLKQSAIIREIEVIGEAVKNISEEIKKANKNINWKGIVGARDKMIHHYFGVDLKIIWKILKEDIPVLKKQILEIKEN
jgi:uncharacterized protein with HEPN domain